MSLYILTYSLSLFLSMARSMQGFVFQPDNTIILNILEGYETNLEVPNDRVFTNITLYGVDNP